MFKASEKWFSNSSALLMVSLLVFAGQSNGQQTKFAAPEFEFCGLGSPPDTAGFVAEYKRQEEQRLRLGYTIVCDAVLRRYDLSKTKTSWREIVPELGFIPVELSATQLAQYELFGGVLDGTTPRLDSLEKTDHAARVFRRPDGRIVSLEEHDLSITGGGIAMVYRPPDLLIKGWPAYWWIAQSKTGKVLSNLSWQGKTRSFSLTVNANLESAGSKAAFVKIAESIPDGIPSGKLTPVVAVLGSPGQAIIVPFLEKPPGEPPKPKF